MATAPDYYIHPVLMRISDELYRRDSIIESLEEEVEQLKAENYQQLRGSIKHGEEMIGHVFELCLQKPVQ